MFLEGTKQNIIGVSRYFERCQTRQRRQQRLIIGVEFIFISEEF
jgi:hypothetical protein